MGYYVLSEDAAAKLRKLLGDASLIEIRAGALQQQPARPMNDPVLYVRVTSLTKTAGRQPGYWQKYIADTDTWSDGDDCWVETPTAVTVLPLGKYLARRFGTRASDGYPIFVADDSGGALEARKGSGSYVGPRPKISFIEGTGCTLTVADDPTAGEIDVTIAVSGSGSTLTVQELDGSPSVSSTNTIKLNQADGFEIDASAGGGVLTVNILEATETQVGVVGTGGQDFAGSKNFHANRTTLTGATGGYAELVLTDEDDNGAGTLLWFSDGYGGTGDPQLQLVVVDNDGNIADGYLILDDNNDAIWYLHSSVASTNVGVQAETSGFYYDPDADDFPATATVIEVGMTAWQSHGKRAGLWSSSGDAVFGLTGGSNPRFAVYKTTWKEGVSGTWTMAGAGVDAGKEITLTFNGGILTLAEEAEA